MTSRDSAVLAVASAHPFNPTTWSGTPAQICHALQGLGIALEPVDGIFGERERWLNLAAGLPDLLRVRRAFGGADPARLALVGKTSGRLRFLRARQVDRAQRAAKAKSAIVFSSSGLARPRPGTHVTLVEDITVAQVAALRGHFPAWDSLRPQLVAKRIERQARDQRAADTVAFLSSWAAEAAIRDYGLDRTRTVVIGVGSRFEPYSGARDWSVPRFLFVGMDWERKNGPLVLEGFAQVRERFPAAELHVVGRHPPIAADGVTGYGRLSQADPAAARQLAELYRSSTCFVLPSTLEPSAVSYAEACSQGIPSIGTVHGGSLDIFGDAGVAVDPNQPGSVAAAMLDLAEPSRAEALGAVAVRRAPLLTWDAVAKRLAGAAGWWTGSTRALTQTTPSVTE